MLDFCSNASMCGPVAWLIFMMLWWVLYCIYWVDSIGVFWDPSSQKSPYRFHYHAAVVFAFVWGAGLRQTQTDHPPLGVEILSPEHPSAVYSRYLAVPTRRRTQKTRHIARPKGRCVSFLWVYSLNKVWVRCFFWVYILNKILPLVLFTISCCIISRYTESL